MNRHTISAECVLYGDGFNWLTKSKVFAQILKQNFQESKQEKTVDLSGKTWDGESLWRDRNGSSGRKRCVRAEREKVDPNEPISISWP